MIIVANLFGTIAVIIWALSIQNKEKEKILIFQTIANIFYTIQYFILKSTTASLLCLISAIRCIVFSKEETKNNKISNKTFAFFLIIALIIGILTFKNILDIIPITCTVLYMYSLLQNNIKITRYIFIIAAIFLMYYNYQVVAYIAIIGNIMDIVSAIISIIRFRKNKNH